MNTENRAKGAVARHSRTGAKPRAAKPSEKARVNRARPVGETRRSKKSAKSARPRKPRNPANTRAALWLWCFPVGLSMMWRDACTWKRGVKIGITAVMAAILIAIFVVPIPKIWTGREGVQLVASKPDVEVYGPALPSLIVPGYTRETTGSILADEVSNNVHYVYAADDARCYHEYECKFAFASSQRMTVYEAYYLGFQPCGRCKPPVYTPGVTDPITAEAFADEAAAQTSADAGTAEQGQTAQTAS